MLNMFRSTPRPTISDIAAKVARNEITLIDVRELAEVKASGKAKGAIVIPLSLIPLKANPSQPGCELDISKPVAVYCASGGRSGMAVQTLARLGFHDVLNLGGLHDWTAGGGQIERI
ncbi:MAG: rhodanese-like domain-containing protein [Paracoccaceae bacterium]